MTVNAYIWICITMYDCVWLYMIMYDYLWLCMTTYDIVWLCTTMHDYAWLCMTMYDYLRPQTRPKRWKRKKKSTRKLKTAQKWRLTFTATAHATFPLDYPSKNDLRPTIMFIIETGNRNPHVKKHDLRQRAKNQRRHF